jgi:hypothetical protein
MVEIKLLQRYRVDREAGMTASGPEQLVILVLKGADVPEMAYAMSKVDAMKIAIQMQLAAQDAQST